MESLRQTNRKIKRIKQKSTEEEKIQVASVIGRYKLNSMSVKLLFCGRK